MNVPKDFWLWLLVTIIIYLTLKNIVLGVSLADTQYRVEVLRDRVDKLELTR